MAALVDHTLLKPEATAADVAALVDEAAELGVYAVCVSPSMVEAAVAHRPAGPLVAAVAGFPSGKHSSEIKAAEAALAVAAGAAEIDMVIDVGAALAGDFAGGARRYRRGAQRDPGRGAQGHHRVGGADEPRPTRDTVVAVCRAAADAGADFVKTSTGFHPAGGASVPAVSLMAATVGGRLGVKASGGIRTAADARRAARRRCHQTGTVRYPCRARRPGLAFQPVTAPRSRGRRWPSGMVAFCVENWLVTPVSVTCTLSAWIPMGSSWSGAR